MRITKKEPGEIIIGLRSLKTLCMFGIGEGKYSVLYHLPFRIKEIRRIDNLYSYLAKIKDNYPVMRHVSVKGLICTDESVIIPLDEEIEYAANLIDASIDYTDFMSSIKKTDRLSDTNCIIIRLSSSSNKALRSAIIMGSKKDVDIFEQELTEAIEICKYLEHTEYRVLRLEKGAQFNNFINKFVNSYIDKKDMFKYIEISCAETVVGEEEEI